MANIIDIRNPKDLTNTYNQIEIQRGSQSDGSDMANITTSLVIDTATANDLSTGYTSYTDSTGATTHYYRWRYKASGSGATSTYSDIFQAGTTVMHTRFRRKMRDTNSANYYFTNEDLDNYLTGAIGRLFPHTYNEVIDESLTTLADTEKYNFPVGINRVNDLELIDTSGQVYSRPRNWKVRARQIIFDNTPPTSYTMRLYADKMFQKLAEIPEFLDDLILDFMRLQAYEDFEADRSKYHRYTTVVNPEGGNMPSIGRTIERLELTTQRRMNALRRVRRPAEIKLA